MSVVKAPEQIVPAGTWKADPAHSTLEFAVKHMLIATIKGRFQRFDAILEGGEQPTLTGTIETGSVDTQDDQRDLHLTSPDFFDSARYPQATFVARGIEPGRVSGELTIKDVTREVELEASFSGPSLDPWGKERFGIELETEIDRNEFGLDWNQPLPQGGVLVGEKVKLYGSFSFVKEA
jgi:polyisoprenoid-binding protein YceI